MLFGRNPNRPYDVRQLFGGAGSQLDRPKHWDSYEMESQKFLQIGEWWKLNTKFCYCFWRENQASQTNLLIVHTTRSQKWWLSSRISWFLNFIAKTEMVMDYVYQFWIFFPGPTPSPRVTRFHVAWNSTSAEFLKTALCGIPLQWNSSKS